MKGMNTDKLSDLGVTEEQLAAVMSSFQKSTVSGTDKPERVRKEVDPDDRCMARTWGSKKNDNEGHGPQCSAKRCGGDYCKSHAKKAAETETPCTWKEGKKFGLFMGRSDQPLTGKDTDGKWQIFWLTPEVKALVDADKEAGTFVLGENELKHKTKSSGPRKPRVKKDPSEKKTKGAKKEKAPKAPRGKNAYMWFAASVRAEFKAQIEAAAGLEGASEEDKAKVSAKGTAKVGDVAKLTGAKWKGMSEEDKKPFEEQSAADKAEKLAAFETTQLIEKAAGIVVAEHDKVLLKAHCSPASPPKAPATDEVFSDADEAEEELAEVMSDKDTEGPWMFEIPEEHAIPAPDGDDDEDWDGTDSIVCELKDGTFAVVPRDWYDDAPDSVEDADYVANMVGTLTDTTYPDEGDAITGTYTPKA
jgi:structure-specific recognition protein 1